MDNLIYPLTVIPKAKMRGIWLEVSCLTENSEMQSVCCKVFPNSAFSGLLAGAQ